MIDVSSWLRTHQVSADAYDAVELLDGFLLEMERGLNGDDSSLAMIPAFVGVHDQVPVGKAVAVVDAGGTNLRVCIVRFNDAGEAELSSFSKQAMPGRDHEISADEFYTVLVDALEPVKDEFDCIGFCFSYPAEIQPDFDGRLLHWTKEIKIPELVGCNIGNGLVQALDARGIPGKQVVVLNDTVAALLAGMAEGQAFHAQSYIGFILGTGTNTAYVEQNANIGKVAELGEGAQVVNVESGGFAAFARSAFDIALDERSENPGGHVFEKAISGVYLGAITLELLKALGREGAFSDKASGAIATMDKLTTIHIANLTADNGRDVGLLGTDIFTDRDRAVMKEVFNAVVDRAALFTAVNLLATVVKSGAGTGPERPVCVNIDGSTYYKTFRLAEKTQAGLQRMLDERGLHIRCVQVEDAPIVGAAIAGLTTFS